MNLKEFAVFSLGAVCGYIVFQCVSGCSRDMDVVSSQAGKGVPSTFCDPNIRKSEYCKANVCAPDGTLTTENDDNNVPPLENAVCGRASCNNGVPVQDFVPEGTPCQGQTGVCTAGGTCVSCIEDTGMGCEAGKTCKSGVCSTCFNDQKDDHEDGIDCGGVCAPCKLGQTCTVNTDCDANSPCVQNVCCDKACDGPCETCPAGSGICIALETGEKGACSSKLEVCANGNCQRRAGILCTNDMQCMSGDCKTLPSGGECAQGAINTPCVDDRDCASNLNCTDHLCQ